MGILDWTTAPEVEATDDEQSRYNKFYEGFTPTQDTRYNYTTADPMDPSKGVEMLGFGDGLDQSRFVLQNAPARDAYYAGATGQARSEYGDAYNKSNIGQEAMARGSGFLQRETANADASRGNAFRGMLGVGSEARDQLWQGYGDQVAQTNALAETTQGYGSGGGAQRMARMRNSQALGATMQDDQRIQSQSLQARRAAAMQQAGSDLGAQAGAQGLYGTANNLGVSEFGANVAQNQAMFDRQNQAMGTGLEQEYQRAQQSADFGKSADELQFNINRTNAGFANWRPEQVDNTGRDWQTVGTIAGTAASLASDERAKTKVRKANTLDAMKAAVGD